MTDETPATDEFAPDGAPAGAPGEADALDRFVASGKQSAQFATSYVLRCFGRTRRGATVNGRIDEWLAANSLEMFPDIRSADYYGDVEIRRVEVGGNGPSSQPRRADAEAATDDAAEGGWVLSSLKDDAEELDFLVYGDSTSDAIELMQQRHRTKLPVFFSRTDKSTLIGTVTLADLTFDKATEHTKLITLATTQVPVVGTNEKLFDWVATILQHGFIYGKNTQGEIVQIYTVFDLASHLNAIAAMFLRANEIEELLREALAGVPAKTLKSAISVRSLTDLHIDVAKTTKLTREEIRPDGSNETDQAPVDGLVFSDYMKAVANETIWNDVFEGHVVSADDKPRCIRSLNDARIARNNVMHFSRAQLPENLIPSFEALAVWLRQVVSARG